MDAAAELGRNPVSTRLSLSMEMSRLTRDGTAEPVSRDQILRSERKQGNIHFPCSADYERTGLATLLGRSIYTLAICVTMHVVVVFVFFPFILDIKFMGRTSRGHTGFFIDLPSAVRALIFIVKMIQPFLSLSSTVKSNFVYYITI